MKLTKVILLGHTGFIGKELLKRLSDKPAKITGIASKDINFLNKKSPKMLAQVLTQNSILIVTSVINRELGDTIDTMQDNIKMISNVAKALEKHPVKKCVYLSTADVYGRPKNLPMTEATPIDPKTYYAVAKYCCESLLQVTCQKIGCHLLILRYSGVFGPGQRRIGYGLNAFIKSILEENVVTLWGSGKELRDSVYVRDLAKAIIKLALGNASGIYNVATGNSRSFRNMVKILQQIFLRKIKVICKKRTSPQFDQVFNSTKLRNKLPRLRFMSMRQALDETVREVKEHFN